MIPKSKGRAPTGRLIVASEASRKDSGHPVNIYIACVRCGTTTIWDEGGLCPNCAAMTKEEFIEKFRQSEERRIAREAAKLERLRFEREQARREKARAASDRVVRLMSWDERLRDYFEATSRRG